MRQRLRGDTGEKSYLKMEAEIGVVLLQAKHCQHPLGARRGKEELEPAERESMALKTTLIVSLFLFFI